MSDPLSTQPADVAGSRRKLLAGMGAVAAGGGLLALTGQSTAEATVSDASYYSYGPIRYCDSRSNSGGRISGGTTRVLSIFSGLQSYTFAINLTVVATAGSSGYLSLYNADLATRPDPYSSINWQGAGKVVANFSLLDLGSAGAKIYCSGGASTSTHFIIDVVGYFYTGGAARVSPPGFDDWERRAKQRLQRERSS
jgi:hypothetical protein